LVAALAIVVVALLIALGVVLSYNRFVAQRGTVEMAWRQVDVELRRRHDLIGGLLTVTRAGGVPPEALTPIVQARSQAMASSGAGPVAQAQAEQVLAGALSAFLSGVGQLRATRDFGLLMDQMSECEERIGAAVGLYNDGVRAFNTRVEDFPTSVIASASKFRKAPYYTTGQR
jgi:LemA protein